MKLSPILYVELRKYKLQRSLNKFKNDFMRFNAFKNFIVLLCTVIVRQSAMEVKKGKQLLVQIFQFAV